MNEAPIERLFTRYTPDMLDALPVGARFVDILDSDPRERKMWTLTKGESAWGRPVRDYDDAAHMIDQWAGDDCFDYRLVLPGEPEPAIGGGAA